MSPTKELMMGNYIDNTIEIAAYIGVCLKP